MSAKPNLQPTLQALLDRDRRGLDEHPTPEALVAYHAGELTSAEQEDLRNHLALCHDCADLLLDLVSFAEFTPPDQTPALADVEVESAWQKFQPRLVASAEASEANVEERLPAVAQIAERRREGGGGFVPRRRLMQAYAIAATLLVGVVGLSVWGISLRRHLTESGTVATVNLYSDKERGGDAAETVPPGSDRFLLLLHPPLEGSELPAFGAEIRPAGSRGAPIVHFDTLLQAEGASSILLHRDKFPPGTYQVDFWGIDGGRKVPFDPLVFQIQP